MRTTSALLSALLCAVSAPAVAEVVVRVDFIEGPEADTITIANVASCPDISITEISLDLSTAAGAVVFDPARGGAGYDDSSTPFEAVEGGNYVTKVSQLEDGGKSLTLALADFDTGSKLEFALDLDDADGAVTGPDEDVFGPDLAGATVAAKIVNARGETRAEVGTFDEQAAGSVAWDGACAPGAD